MIDRSKVRFEFSQKNIPENIREKYIKLFIKTYGEAMKIVEPKISSFDQLFNLKYPEYEWDTDYKKNRLYNDFMVSMMDQCLECFNEKKICQIHVNSFGDYTGYIPMKRLHIRMVKEPDYLN